MKITTIYIPLHIGCAFYCVGKSFTKHKAKIKNAFVSTLAAGRDFSLIKRHGCVTYNVYFYYNLDIKNI